MDRIEEIRQARYGKNVREPVAAILESLQNREESTVKAEVVAARGTSENLKQRIDSFQIEENGRKVEAAEEEFNRITQEGIACRGVYVGTTSGKKELFDMYRGTATGVNHSYHKEYLVKDGVLKDGLQVSASSFMEQYEFFTDADRGTFNLKLSANHEGSPGGEAKFTFENIIPAGVKNLFIEYDAEDFLLKLDQTEVKAGAGILKKKSNGIIRIDEPTEKNMVVEMTRKNTQYWVQFAIKNLYVIS